MLSIIVLIFLLFILFSLRRKKDSPALNFGILGLFNLLLVEIACYIYFLFLISQGSSFLLIGHQRFLDKAIEYNIFKTLAIDENSPYSVFRLDPRLGYAPAKNKMYYQHKNLNSQGLREVRNYSIMPPPDKLRMAAFGDSFVFCDGELAVNCWTDFLENSLGNIEVMNFGVSGYGLGQSYLRYLNDGLRYNPDVIFINYVAVTDRDKVASKAIANRKSLRNADAYRILFGIEEGVLITKNMTPLDLFNVDFRRQHIYRPLGINERDPLFNRTFFSSLNIGLFFKQHLAQKKFDATPPPAKTVSDELINIKIIENLLNEAQINNTDVIFFVKEKFEELPMPIQALLKQHSSHVVYVNSEVMLNHYFHGGDRQPFLNKTNHFNAKGNMIYAHAVSTIFDNRIWGHGERRFAYDPGAKSFIRLRKSTETLIP